jgi:hypothetical protein
VALSRRKLLGWGVAAFFGAGGAMLLGRKRRDFDPSVLRQRAEAIGARHQIRIGYGAPESFVVAPFPAERAAIVGGVVGPVELSALPPALDGIEESLGVYPAGFFSTLCKAIFICGSLTLDGAEAGGTYGPVWLVLVATSKVGDRGIVETARLGVHHEFSSLVWNALPGLPPRWAALLPREWSPASTNAEALAAAARDGGRARDDGFLSAYGATTAENDFNVYAETAFADAGRLASAAARSTIVARKTAHLLAAYHRLDARFATVFERLGLWRLRDAALEAVLVDTPAAGAVSPGEPPAGIIVRPGDNPLH